MEIMGISVITPLLLFAATVGVRSESLGSYTQSSHRGRSAIGDILKPPPPPFANILPVPFHSGASGTNRKQRQNTDLGYNYQIPPPLPPVTVPASPNFNFPSPFYKQYNFNFVPPPQPFSTPSSPSLFQKVSNWLFPSTHSTPTGGLSYETNQLGPVKKDCNPCNLVPWLPVIKYNVQKSNFNSGSSPTYGPPSPTSVVRNNPEPFQYSSQSFESSPSQNLNFQVNKQTIGIPHEKYGPPGFHGAPASTYGPPSPTHSISETLKGPSSTSTFVSTYNNPSVYSTGDSKYKVHLENDPAATHTTEVEIVKSNTADNEFHLPKVYYPNRFKNNFGESITNNHVTNIPATAEAASKLKSEFIPFINFTDSNASLSKPAPFTSNRGRNIHTLQPVALPNLSISPLPPIFNARPFQNFPPPIINAHNIHTLNNLQKSANEIKVVKSVPVAEFTHSIEYPATIIQSPIVDLDTQKRYNQSKSYRNIPNAYLEDETKDASSQASEDHISATKTETPNSSFRENGTNFESSEYSNVLQQDPKSYFKGVPNDLTLNFKDFRGNADNVLDKHGIENNFKLIDSHLLYLKPSAPYREYDNFLPTPIPDNNDYEIYDDIPTTTLPPSSTVSENWNKYKADDYTDIPSSSSLEKNVDENSKILQIIIPYTMNQNNVNSFNAKKQWKMETINENQGRKIPLHTENNFFNTITERDYITQTTNIREITASVTEQSDNTQLNSQTILNDLYNVKEQPFDIIRLQNNIDGWTEQEFSKDAQNSEGSIGKYAYAKQIPDEFFTTTNPISTYPTTNNPEYNFDDHEGSSSMQHSAVLKPLSDSSTVKSKIEYNTVEKSKDATGTNDKKTTTQYINSEKNSKPYIFTAASSFRTTSTTVAPWEKIQTSISPLTKEKVYVVTSKPWKDVSVTNRTWQEGSFFESKRTSALDNNVSGPDNLPFKSPRFSNRPSIALSSRGNVETLKHDSSFAFSKTWHKSINDLEVGTARTFTNHTNPPDGPLRQVATNTAEESSTNAEGLHSL